jgi:Family of unknown function (DUF7033)
MVDVVVSHPPGLETERRYACDVVLRDWLGLDYRIEVTKRADIRIVAADDASGRALRLPDIFFPRAANAWLKPESLPIVPLALWTSGQCGGILHSSVPVLFGEPQPTRRAMEDDQARLPIDIFGSIFFMLTRYEEIVSDARDEFDRFPGAASFSHRFWGLERPLANEYLEILWAHMQRLWPRLRRRVRTYTVDLSHDVDRPFAIPGRSWTRIGLSAGADIIRRRTLGLAVRRLRAKLAAGPKAARLDPNNSFAFMMATSERHGLKSTFFFMAGVSDSRFDERYALDTPPIASLLKEIHTRGHELGLHPSYHTYRNPVRIRIEFETLLRACDCLGIRQAAWGGRQHYLRFSGPATWRHYASAGLAYDATLAHADQPGFRCGTCYDFPVYDLEQNRSLPLRERPLIVMESNLLGQPQATWGGRAPDGLALAPEAARERITPLAAVCRHFAGTFSLLWHNTWLITRAQQRFYQDIIGEIAR